MYNFFHPNIPISNASFTNGYSLFICLPPIKKTSPGQNCFSTFLASGQQIIKIPSTPCNLSLIMWGGNKNLWVDYYCIDWFAFGCIRFICHIYPWKGEIELNYEIHFANSTKQLHTWRHIGPRCVCCEIIGKTLSNQAEN